MSVPSVISPTAVYDFAQATVDAVANALESTPNGKPQRSIVTFGEIAWDDSTCGQLALSYVQSYPSRSFPTQTQVRLNCPSAMLVHQFTLELARCAPGVGANGEPPSVDAMNTYARGMMYDAYVMRTTLTCILAGLMEPPQQIADWQINEDRANGPLGDSAGNALNFLVAWWQDCECGD